MTTAESLGHTWTVMAAFSAVLAETRTFGAGTGHAGIGGRNWRALIVAEGRTMPTGPASPEASMEARIARLESDVTHLRSDVADIKVDLRSLRDKMDGMYAKLSEKIDALDQKLTAKIDGVYQTLIAKIDGVDQKLTSKIDGLEDSIAAAKSWALILYIALAAAMLGTMARGFGWI